MIDLRAPALSEYQLLIKRAFDLSLTVVGMVVALPLMGLLALLILILDGPPVIFRQARAGENGRSFVIYKFRSMVPGAEAVREPVAAPRVDGDLQNKSPDDPRVTPIGRFLRRTSLDELPQLFNVLRGEMSLVGPRPEMPFLVETYQPWQRKRFSVPPGLTGWWQINGRSDRPMHLNTEDDLYYINNYSIWLDIEILVRTLWVVIVGRGSY
jgi:exopolysaccharide biosynthesis polyprenyl glycosylphosphotransferase